MKPVAEAAEAKTGYEGYTQRMLEVKIGMYEKMSEVLRGFPKNLRCSIAHENYLFAKFQMRCIHTLLLDTGLTAAEAKVLKKDLIELYSMDGSMKRQMTAYNTQLERRQARKDKLRKVLKFI
jgi:hypothetical protein